VLIVAVLTVSGNTSIRSEEVGAAQCESCGAACQKGKLVECVVMVPKTVIERRTGTRCVQIKDTVIETYTVFERVPVTKKVLKKECFLVDKVEKQTVEEKVCHLIEVPVEIVHPAQELLLKGCGKGDASPEKTEAVTENCTRTEVVFETKKKDVAYCVKSPEYRETECAEIHTFEFVPRERTREVHVCSPFIETYPIEVTVCKMVPTKVACCDGCARHHK
jgi:hypothetical protein